MHHNASRKVNAAPCTAGSTGYLCGICTGGWKKGPAGSCSPCDESNGGWLNPLLLIPAAIAAAYVALRTLLTAKRQKRIKALGAAKELFADIDTDQSGEITRDELRQGLSLLSGVNLTEETVAALIEQIDLDHDGLVDEHEFVAWLEHSRSGMQVSPFLSGMFSVFTSQLIQGGWFVQTTTMVGKIVLGLAQVLTKQPDILRSKELIEQFQDHPWLQVFSFNFSWIMPVCQVDYEQTFVLNTLVFPVCMGLLVAATWASNPPSKGTQQGNDTDAAEARRERTTMWRSDMYFALFLSCEWHSPVADLGVYR